MMGRFLGSTTGLSHKDGGIPLNALPKDITSKLAGLFSSLSLCAERQAGKLSIPFLKSFGMTRLDELNPGLPTAKQTLQHYAIAPVKVRQMIITFG